MTKQLLAYLFDELSADERAEVEQRLADDPAWRQELERLEDCIAASGDPTRCAEEPPRDLVKRTCGLVERASHCRMSAASATSTQGTPRSRPWSFADYTVCASVLAAVGMLVLPAICESREASRRIACQNNLRALGTVMLGFAQRHGNRPPGVRPGEGAGVIAVKLAELGGVPRHQLAEILVCPASAEADQRFKGCRVCYIPTLAELEQAHGVILQQMFGSMGNVAYAIGNYDEHNQYQDPVCTGDPMTPLAADGPRVTKAGVRSVNHNGQGQNVLFQDMHVKFLTDCCLAARGEQFYLNDAGERAAGRRFGDIVVLDPTHGPAGAVGVGPH